MRPVERLMLGELRGRPGVTPAGGGGLAPGAGAAPDAEDAVGGLAGWLGVDEGADRLKGLPAAGAGAGWLVVDEGVARVKGSEPEAWGADWPEPGEVK